jgi:hypothetical protein
VWERERGRKERGGGGEQRDGGDEGNLSGRAVRMHAAARYLSQAIVNIVGDGCRCHLGSVVKGWKRGGGGEN